MSTKKTKSEVQDEETAQRRYVRQNLETAIETVERREVEAASRKRRRHAQQLKRNHTPSQSQSESSNAQPIQNDEQQQSQQFQHQSQQSQPSQQLQQSQNFLSQSFSVHISQTPSRRTPKRLHKQRSLHGLSSSQSTQFFECDVCCVPRPLDCKAENTLCVYCFTGLTEEEDELKFCHKRNHATARANFFTDNVEHSHCNNCREISSSSQRYRQSIQVLSEEREAYQTHSDLNSISNLDSQAVLNTSWQSISAFHQEINDFKLITCLRCDERWFNMKLRDNVCEKCRYRDRGQSIHLISDENNMNVQAVPSTLPQLTDIEEMLIARAHVHVQVYMIKDHQYKYSGHTVTFMQNTQKLYNKLPLLLEDLDILILKPATHSSEQDQLVNKQFV